MKPISFKRLNPEAILPSAAHTGDAGLDLHSTESLTIGPGERRLVKTGLAVAIPDGFCGLVLPRSGLAIKNGITVVNGPGLIDSGYRGEIGVILLNTDQHDAFAILAGDRIAQILITPFEATQPIWVDRLEETERGSGGFGSTGTSNKP